MDYEKLIEWLKKTVLGRICALGGQREDGSRHRPLNSPIRK